MANKILKSMVIFLFFALCLVGTCNAYDLNAILDSNDFYVYSPSNAKPTGSVEPIVIEYMVREDNPGFWGSMGFGYMGTLIAKDKTYIIKLYQSDWDEIMRMTNRNPIGKTIYVKLEHDDFEMKWDGDDFYYIEDFY